MGLFSRNAKKASAKEDSNYTPPNVDGSADNVSVESGSGSDEEAMIITSPSKDQGATQKDPEKGEAEETAAVEETKDQEEEPKQDEGSEQNNEQENYISVEKSDAKEVATSKPRESTAAAASYYANMKAAKAMTMAERGPYYIHILGTIGGVIMIAFTVLDWLKYNFHHDVTHALVAVYTCIFGFIVCVLEEEELVHQKIGETARNALYRNANFLQFVWGRGLLFFCSGTLQLSQMSFFSKIGGGYMMVLGLIALYHGREAALKLYNLRESISDEAQLQQIFNENDSSGDGYLERGDFSNLADQIGLELSKEDEEEAFVLIDKDGDGKLSFKEFRAWWSSYKFDTAFPSP